MAASVVANVNKSVANRLGWHIDLHRWEETPPSFGRPQDSINPLLDQCDLFVGLLWRWWGQPTGIHSSGFEEEFERARARRKTGGVPEIWLMFKDIGRSTAKDPGDQLKKVIQFRELQTRLNEVKYANVKNAEDWGSKLQSWLSQHIIDFAAAHPEPSATPTITAPLPAAVRNEADEESSALGLTSGLPAQLRAASASLGAATASDRPDLFDQRGALSEFEVARVFLLSTAVISRRYTNSVLGTHEINLLYKHRGELDAATDEQIVLLRSIVGGEGDVKPGWFWFRNLDEELLFDQLLKFAIDDAADDVRIGAIDLMTLSRFEIPQESWPLLPIRHESWGVRTRAFNYLAELGGESTIKFLDSVVAETEDSLIISDARDARFKILSRLNPDAAFTEATSKDPLISPEKIKLLEKRAQDASDLVLLQGATSSLDPMRVLCARELMRRRRLPVETAHALAQDSSLAVRAFALASLAETGHLPGPRLARDVLKDQESASRSLYGALGGEKDRSIPDLDDIIIAFYSSQSVEDTLAAVDWYSIDGLLAYKALALNHFETVKSTIGEDVENGFRRIRQDALRRIEETGGPEKAKEADARFQKYDSFFEWQFREAALLGIAKNGLPGAAEIARPFLAQDKFGLLHAAVKVICNFGDSGYTHDLLRIAKSSYGDLSRDAAQGALKISPKPLETAAELLKSDGKDLPRVAFSWLLGREGAGLGEALGEFLRDADAEFRLPSLLWLFKRLKTNDLEAALTSYLANETYYYDVVTWLDRLLYAPQRLRGAFARELAEKAI